MIACAHGSPLLIADADAALAVVRRQYPEAFVVPDRVTVMR